MSKRVLITGGAGFIGSHVADELIRCGHHVRVLDNLTAQVHGRDATRPDYLHPDVDLVIGDVLDPESLRRALREIEVVYHFAAAVGVGQSMYEVVRYTEVNSLGTALLMQEVARHPIERLIVASSMSVYGEGLYRAPGGSLVAGVERSMERLRAKDWEVRDAQGAALVPVPTPEDKAPAAPSIYALTKLDQERMCLMIGRAYNIPTVALRFFNVFGTRQALSNPYTGVLAIFASRLLNGNPPLINEDGYQQRDFVSVLDVAQACRLALEVPGAAGYAFNIGSGRPWTIRSVAESLIALLGAHDIRPEITERYRVGDIRHCFADISLARRVLGYEPRVTLEDGLIELLPWLEAQVAVDRVPQAAAELATMGLTI